MVQNDYPQSNPGTIEALKAARDQVIQADPPRKSQFSNGAGKSAAANFPRVEDKQESTVQVHNKFAEEFVRKLSSIEQEKVAVDEEMVKVEKLWSSLVEKKKQLEDRRNELTKVEDRLKELDKEMNDVLKHFILF